MLLRVSLYSGRRRTQEAAEDSQDSANMRPSPASWKADGQNGLSRSLRKTCLCSARTGLQKNCRLSARHRIPGLSGQRDYGISSSYDGLIKSLCVHAIRLLGLYPVLHSQSERQLSDWIAYGKVTTATRADAVARPNAADAALVAPGTGESFQSNAPWSLCILWHCRKS
ncbi:MAG: hypothetical protein JWQ49_1065 [Edaphobacter sp.]|nr:hypothetical protein [Edaphobacter sp.]